MNICAGLTCSILLQFGNTTLHYASRKDHTELCKLLLGAKADVEAKDQVLVATRGERHLGNMRTGQGQR